MRSWIKSSWQKFLLVSVDYNKDVEKIYILDKDIAKKAREMEIKARKGTKDAV